MEPYTLLWINDTQLVEANATQVRCYNQQESFGRLDKGAKLLVYHPVSHPPRYTWLRPKEAGGDYTFRDWHWQTGAVEDVGWGSIWAAGAKCSPAAR